MSDPTYRIDGVAYARRAVCECGWTSRFERLETAAVKAWERHVTKEHAA